MAPVLGLPQFSPASAHAAQYNARLIRLRWLAGLAVLAATLFGRLVLGWPLPPSLFALGLVILAYDAALSWAARRWATPAPGRMAEAQLAADGLALIVFVHLTGGIESLAIWFFLFHVLLAPIVLPGRAPFIFAGLVILAVAGLAGLEAVAWLPHYRVVPLLPDGLYRQPLYAAGQLVFFAVTVGASVGLMAPIARDLREHERQSAALLLGTRALSSSLDLPRVLEALVRGVALALQSQAAAIRLLDQTGRLLDIGAAYGLSQKYLEKGSIEIEHSRIDQEALSGQPVIVEQAAANERLQYPAEIAAEGIQSILCVPIIGRRGPLGVLRVYSARPQFFTQANASFALAIAHQGATAIENAQAYEALRRTDKDKSQFVRAVTHELRAPVAGGQSLLRTVTRDLAGSLNAPQRDVLGRLADRLDFLQMLINDLLDLASGRVEGLAAQSVPVSVEAVALGVKDRLDAQAQARQIDLRVDYVPGGLTVMASEDGLSRLFLNLIGNALKYTPPGGSVNVTLQPRGDEAVIEVADTGMGIPEPDRPHLFEEFFRASNARAAGIPGTGLGLAIVKDLVERYGGRIAVQGNPGRGTVFQVFLPLAK